MKAWHFVEAMLRDGRPIPADGEKLVFAGTPILCQQGLHASLHPFDALHYAPGAILCLVDCDGQVVQGNDKLVCTERTIIARMDATPLLHYFARQQALSVVHLWDAPQVVLDYLMGDDAARSATYDAARSATYDAARNATYDATWYAAWEAARDAARGAAWAAARNETWDAAKAEFQALVHEAFADWL